MFIKLNHHDVKALIAVLEEISNMDNNENPLTDQEQRTLDKLKLIQQTQISTARRLGIDTTTTTERIYDNGLEVKIK